MNEIDKLLEKWHTLPSEEEDQFIKSVVEDYNAKTNDEKCQFIEQMNAGTVKACTEADELIETLTMRNQLEPILSYISVSAIAKEYFGKSRHWLYQRINGNMVNGKPAKFTREEKTVLKDAITDIINKLQGIKTSLG